jgi:Protein of unknown function (DUF433)
MPEIAPPDQKAQPLLRLIVDAIKAGRIRAGTPDTFLGYAEALELLGSPSPAGYAGVRLQKAGLTALNEWTIAHRELPKIAALIVNKKTRIPGNGFPESHGYRTDDAQWQEWWLQEANRAINFDWTPFITPVERQHQHEANTGLHVREDEERAAPSYRDIIVADPPPARIRRSRIPVGDVLRWLATGQSENEILRLHRELRRADIRASLAYAADREKPVAKPSFTARWTGKFELPAPDPADARLTHLLERYERNRR